MPHSKLAYDAEMRRYFQRLIDEAHECLEIKKKGGLDEQQETGMAEYVLNQLTARIKRHDGRKALWETAYGQGLLAGALLKEFGQSATTGRSIRTGFKRARNTANEGRHADAAAEWGRWQTAANEYWERHPGASKAAAAGYVRKRLELTRTTKTISRRLKKVAQAS